MRYDKQIKKNKAKQNQEKSASPRSQPMERSASVKDETQALCAQLDAVRAEPVEPETSSSLRTTPDVLADSIMPVKITSTIDQSISASDVTTNQAENDADEELHMRADGTGENRADAPVQGIPLLWRIRGTFTLETPLHLGTGHDEQLDWPKKKNQTSASKPPAIATDAVPQGGVKADAVPVAESEEDEIRQLTVACIARDHEDKPYIPASSLKGALRALAERYGLEKACTEKLFGQRDIGKGDTKPGAVEFCNAYLAIKGGKDKDGSVLYHLPGSSGLPHYNYSSDQSVKDNYKARALLPHAVRDRDYGTAREKLLFHEQVIPPGTIFQVECTLSDSSRAQVETLLSVLEAANDVDSTLRLGGGKAANQGRVKWALDPGDGVKELQDLSKFWEKVQSANGQPLCLWDFSKNPVPSLKPRVLAEPNGQQLVLNDLTLDFHTPFLVYHATPGKKKDDGQPNGSPRVNHDNQGVLPSTSLHGALRSQAERILRTVGLIGVPAYDLKSVDSVEKVRGEPAAPEKADEHGTPLQSASDDTSGLDLAALLFGAPGWRSLVTCTDFLVQPVVQKAGQAALQPEPVLLHHNAIDRLTGGGKKGALFTIKAYDCPILKGGLRLDLHRINELWKDIDDEENRKLQQTDTLNKLLGLLAHVLRDLDEGDIPLGYGAAKGYGACTSKTVDTLKAQTKLLPLLPNGINLSFDQAIEFFSKAAKAGSAPDGAKLQAVAGAPSKITPAGSTNEENHFHNPYAFLPFGKPNKDDPRLPWSEYKNVPADHHSHKRYAPDALHGRLVCRLKTLTPIFIGAGDAATGQQDDKAKLKANFKLKEKITLPATTLRGMLSSLHESITRSALRVMEERNYSVRQTTGGEGINVSSSSAIGRIHIRDKEIFVEPLTLPTMELIDDYYTLPVRYKACRFKENNQWKAYQKVLMRLANVENYQDSDFKKALISGFTDKNSSGYWYLRVKPIVLYVRRQGEGFPRTVTRRADRHETLLHQKIKKNERGRETARYLIAQHQESSTEHPLSKEEFENSTANKADFVRGLLRIMAYSVGGKERNLPPERVRHFEMFIPCPESPLDPNSIGLKCTELCLSRFRHLAKERHDLKSKDKDEDIKDTDIKARLLTPYTPVNLARKNAILEPSPGDIVFFKPSENGKDIDEISYSSIWRARVEFPDPITGKIVNYGARQALPELSDPDVKLAPFYGDDTRSFISPSELLFGFLQDMGESDDDKPALQGEANSAKAFASKVRFGFGRHIDADGKSVDPLLHMGQGNQGITLKILDSPKPPCPPFYFNDKNQSAGQHIPKADLVKSAENFKHKGRKVYLHALTTQPDSDGVRTVQKLDYAGSTTGNVRDPWETCPVSLIHGLTLRQRAKEQEREIKQKVRITPIQEKQDFYFEVDFQNLSQFELESLCATLMPADTYYHKIGMGKPIGLGSVKIDVVGMFLLDRQARYRQTEFTYPELQRYAGVWRDGKFPAKLPAHLRPEEAATGVTPDCTPEQMANRQMQALQAIGAAPELYNAIVLTGDPEAVKYPVHYPQVATVSQRAKSIEMENFNWFVDNDKASANPSQHLEGFTDKTDSLPTLKRHPKIER